MDIQLFPACSESKIEEEYRKQLFVLGESQFGEGFWEYCCYQKPFITTEGTVEGQLLGVDGSGWAGYMSQTRPPKVILDIATKTLCVSEFAIKIDDCIIAIFLETDYQASNKNHAARRTRDRGLLYLGIIPVRFTLESVASNPKSAAEQTLAVLDKILQSKHFVV